MMLETRRLTVRYGAVEALSELDLSVKAGEIVSILGANGAGKTTLARAISRLVAYHHGDILFEGRSLLRCSSTEAVRAGIVQVPEGRLIFPDLTVRENLLMGAYTRGRREAAAALEEVCHTIPILAERLAQKGGTLSGGEQQMLALGRALMAKPKLLILDEPSMGLAPIMVDRVYEVIGSLRSPERSIVLIEQNLRQAFKVADRFYVLQVGRKVYEGDVAAVEDEERFIQTYL